MLVIYFLQIYKQQSSSVLSYAYENKLSSCFSLIVPSKKRSKPSSPPTCMGHTKVLGWPLGQTGPTSAYKPKTRSNLYTYVYTILRIKSHKSQITKKIKRHTYLPPCSSRREDEFWISTEIYSNIWKLLESRHLSIPPGIEVIVVTTLDLAFATLMEENVPPPRDSRMTG